MKKYSEYKDSGVEWISEIPSHWNISKVKYKVDINKNVLSEKTSEEYEITYIDIGSVNSLGEITNTEVMEFKNSPSRARRIVKSKDTIISTVRTYLKAITYIDQAQDNLVCSTGFTVLSPLKGLDYRYLGMLFRSSNYIHEIVKRSKGVSYPAITSTEIGDMELIFPSLNEQEQIVNYLNKKTLQIEALIRKKEELIETLKASRTKLISETVTQGLNKHVPMKDSGVEWIGEIPSHWNVSKLKYNLDTTKGYAFKADLFGDEGVPVVKASDIKNKTIVESDAYISHNIANKYKSVMLLEGDVIMSTVGSTPDVKNSAVGQLAYIPKNVEGSLLNQNTVILRINHNSILYKRFLFYMLCSNKFRKYLDLYAHGTANQASLSLVDILNYDIAIPNKEEQYKIVDYLDEKTASIDMLILKTNEQIEILKKAKQKLITEVVTGKIDVTDL